VHHASLAALALLAVPLARAVPAQTIDACGAGKTKCIVKSVKGFFGCHAKAETQGKPVSQRCLDKSCS
jgi:hypothetical protein